MRSLYSVALAVFTLALAGCLSDAKDPDAPPPGTGDGVPELPLASAAFRAQFDPLKLVMPYPNDILGFLAQPGTDGTLNLPAERVLQPLAPLVNQLDGFSTNAPIQANFTRAVAPESLNPGTVFLLEVAINPANKAVVGLSDEAICKLNPAAHPICEDLDVTPGAPILQQGLDYSVRVAPDMDAGGQTIELKPLRPLNSNRPNTINAGTENGYLMILTNGITDTSGNPAQPDTTYAQIRGGFLAGAFPLPPPAELAPEQRLPYYIVAHLAVSAQLGLPVDNIVVTASFTTQDTTTVLETVAEMAEAGPSTIQPLLSPVPLPAFDLVPGSQVTTNVVLALRGLTPENQPAGSGDVYVGALTVPYYLAPAVPPPPGTPGCATAPVLALCAPWVAATELGDTGSRTLSKFNPVPAKRVDMPIPVLITIPNANNAAGGDKPEAGWPVVIFQHGITTNRTLTFALTQPLNNLGYAVVAIDLPLHGIPEPAIDFDTITPEELEEILLDRDRALALLRVPGVPERHFDLDLQNNATGAPGPDGNIDSSGAHFINLSNGLVSRDNLRQATADLITLIRSIPTMDVDGGGPDFDGSRIHIIGMSLGAMVVTNALAFDDTAVTASLGMPGGVLSDLLLDSFSFGGLIEAGLIANRLTPNTSLYNNFIRDLQSLVDAGDAINHGRSAAASGVPIHFIQADGDLTVPNSASNRLAAEMKRAGLTNYDYETASESGIPGVKVVVDPAGLTARVCFTNGATHGSQVSPGEDPTPESLAVTREIQAQQAVFIAGTPPELGGLPDNGRTLLFGGSMNPLAAGAYGNFEDDCDAANRPRTNVN